MLFVDESAEAQWTKCLEKSKGDEYSEAAVKFAEKLASLLEEEIKASRHSQTPEETIAKTAEKASQSAADIYDVTGFQYGWAVGALAQVWFYGKELKAWHNRKYDHDGPGVANPAVIVVQEGA